MLFKSSILLCIIIKCVSSARILGIFWTSSQSHHISGVPLLQTLARKGHTVHLLSTFRDNVNISTYKQTLLTGIFESSSSSEIVLDSPSKILNHVFNLPYEIQEISENFWKNKPVQEIIQKKPKYDVVICLAHHTDHIFPIANYLNAPLILFTPVSTNLLENKYVGNPNLPYYTQPAVEENPETFIGRLSFFSFNALMAISDKFILSRLYQKITRQYLPEAPRLAELDVSLILVNSHYSIELPRPYVPNMIPIGGYHIFEASKEVLPNKLLDFLNEAKEGAIVFSMGTNLKVASMFDMKVLMGTFRTLRMYKILFRCEVPVPSVPDNVMVVDWIPKQVNVLGHPNVKLFITHGGLDGITEAIYHAVPLLGIPYTGEQKANINFAVQCGFAMRLDYWELNEHTLLSSILSVIKRNPSFAINAQKRSILFRNRPINPMKLAIWWVEHIIENKGGEHLKNVVADFEWYKVYMLDIVFFYVILVVGTTLFYYVLVKYMLVKKPKTPLEQEEPAVPVEPTAEESTGAAPKVAIKKKGKKPKRH